jgi:hypothetical protein
VRDGGATAPAALVAGWRRAAREDVLLLDALPEDAVRRDVALAAAAGEDAFRLTEAGRAAASGIATGEAIVSDIGSGANASERGPPPHAEKATASTARHDSTARRPPIENVKDSPDEDARTIVGGRRGLKCGDPDCDEKGDTRREECICVPYATRGT